MEKERKYFPQGFKMINKIKLFFKYVSLNSEEKKFIKSKLFIKKSEDSQKILFQIPMDYYFLLMSKTIILERHQKNQLIGIWPYFFNPQQKKNFSIFEITNFLKNKFFFYFLKKKWSKIYKHNNINLFLDFSKIKLSSLYFALKNFSKINNKIKTKRDILNIKFKNIHVGDLIYDTYIRYRARPEVDIRDKYLKFIIFYSLIIFKNINLYLIKNKPKIYYTSYSSYINHGLLVRVFISKNIKVISLPRNYGNNYSNLLTKKFPYAKKNYYNLLSQFKKIKNKKKSLILSKNQLNNRFQGRKENLTKYLKHKAQYNIINYKNNSFNYEGVVFLHDFYDAPHEAGLKIFSDFYEWFKFTAKTVNQYNLNFAFKFHPNSKPESIKFNKYLKSRYKEINFLPEKTSNTEIFKSQKFKVGISVCGSVLYELILFKKNIIYLSPNLVSPLNLIKLPQSKDDYKHQLVNYHLLKKINQQDISNTYKLYYMLQKDQSYLDLQISKKIKLKDLNFRDSRDLNKFNNKIINNSNDFLL